MTADVRARYAEERLPRYTSYPTSPQFSPAVAATTYGEWLAALTPGTVASLYLHVPFCRAMCWYCGCHTSITPRHQPVSDYLDVLRREIDLVAGRIGHRLEVGHIHFGGGTPTIMEPQEFLGLVDLLRQRFSLTDGAEIAVEIDPRTLSPAMATALGMAGVTRASLGIQSFDPGVQAAINRRQSVEQTAQAVDRLRRAGIRALNFDLIYGLPHQTVESCEETVRRCLALEPDRFSVFGYAHVPSFKKHQGRIDQAALPDGAARRAQAESIAAAITTAGYHRIGLDHFARPLDAMAQAQAAGRLHRNFQGYTNDTSDALLGFGASAIGKLSHGYVQNEVAIPRYSKLIAEGDLATVRGCLLGSDDRLRAEIIERIMCDFSVDLGHVCRKHGASADALLSSLPRLRQLEADGLIALDGAKLEIQDDMRVLVRTVAATFDAYLGASGRAHSRVV